jgi:hypothetical protein
MTIAESPGFRELSDAVGAEMRKTLVIPALDLSKAEDRRQALYEFARSMVHASRGRHGGRFAYRSEHESTRRGMEDRALLRADRRFFDAARRQAMDEREACAVLAEQFSPEAAAAIRGRAALPDWREKD